MKVALINGSPKFKESASKSLLEDIKKYIGHQSEVIEINMHKQILSDQDLQQLINIDALVIACPLYVDGIPGHLLSCLAQLENIHWHHHKVNVYGIVNCGFYEGIQAEFALHILENWCLKSQVSWAGGIGIGGGGGLAQMPSAKGKGPKAPVDKALQDMSQHILQCQTQDNCYVSVAFPRFLYKMAAQMGWRQLIRSNGGKIKDLSKQWK